MGKEFHEWFKMGARHDLKRKEEVAGRGPRRQWWRLRRRRLRTLLVRQAEEAVAAEESTAAEVEDTPESMEVEGVEAGDGGEVRGGEGKGGGGDAAAALVQLQRSSGG